LSIPKCKYKGKHLYPATPPKTPAKPAPSKPVRQAPPISPATGYENGHGWVDLGLSVKWATCNVGATNPSDYGGYYAWGETQPKSRYGEHNYFDRLGNNDESRGIYKLNGKRVITPTSGHDTAHENWGGRWRMPTDAENEELSRKCKWRWTSKNGHNGYVVTGPNGNSIFLPAAGCRKDTDFKNVGENGCYWSSTLSSSYSFWACNLYLYSRLADDFHYPHSHHRYYGLSVRPVAD
ncbi:MAG: hypothetical protein K2K03_05510, partial [Prevotella sp.]|nr:hypothetical protein [Prevotella sp.]